MGLGLSKENSFRPGPEFVVKDRRYRFLDFIGRGGEAMVYRCEDQTARQYAVKLFDFSLYNPSERQQRILNFRKQSRILKFLGERSRHFIYLYDYEYNRLENRGYMIMEIGNGSLRDYLQGYPLNETLRKEFWKQIVTILKDLDDAHIVHADIKPENMIFVDGVLKVTDLGLAFPIESARHILVRDKVRGTLDYMAPEVFHYETGLKSDVWSAGIILYEMVFGRPPYYEIFDRDEKVLAITSNRQLVVPRIEDRHLYDCLRRCLRFDIRRRPTGNQLMKHPYTRI